MHDFSARLLAFEDKDRVDCFLKPHTPFALFMRSNLAEGGILFEGKPYQAEYFGAFDAEGLKGILSHGWRGNVQLFVTDHDVIPVLAKAWTAHLAKHPRNVELILGPLRQIQTFLDALNLKMSDFRRGGSEEKLFALSLDKMTIPPLLIHNGVRVRRAILQDADLVTAWRYDYFVDILKVPPGDEARAHACEEIHSRIKKQELFVLDDNGTLRSFCGIGSFLKDWTNVGPVWTPPPFRNKGYARACVAGALEILREEGITHAALFAVEPAAKKAYEAIGFEIIGDWFFGIIGKKVWLESL